MDALPKDKPLDSPTPKSCRLMSLDVDRCREATEKHRWDEALKWASGAFANVEGEGRLDLLGTIANIRRLSGRLDEARADLRSLWEYVQQNDLAPDPKRVMSLAAICETLGELEVAQGLLRRSKRDVAEPAGLAIMERRIEQGLANRAKLAGHDVRVIPLGQECLPFNILMRWGFAEFAVEGPFTAGVFREAVPVALREYQASFLHREAYTTVRTPAGLDAPFIPKYGALLNHETGPFFCDNNMENLTALYRRRVAALHEAVSSGSKLIFLVERSAGAITPIVDAVRDVYPDRRAKFLIIDVSSDDSIRPASSILVIRSKRPEDNYIWHHPNYFNTEEGLSFEVPIQKALAAEIGSLE